MTRLLLIDCRSQRVARYDGRKASDEFVIIRAPLDANGLDDLQAFRAGGWAALDAVQKARDSQEAS